MTLADPSPVPPRPSPAPDAPAFAGPGAWFAGPKGENAERFARTIDRIIADYHAWRRNYFPEDGVVIDSAARRENEHFEDAFDDRLMELLGRLKADFPFHSPRYAAHMLAEQTLPSIAGYFAAMLYNPNNVSSDSAPVTIRLELEASRMIARMLGYGDDCWAHLTSGGTVANIEALWIARTVKYLPLVVSDMRAALGLSPAPGEPARGAPMPYEPGSPAERARVALLLRTPPGEALAGFHRCFTEAKGVLAARGIAPEEATRRCIRAFLDSPFNVVERGLPSVCALLGSEPALLVPESHHYCFEKAMDALGFGRRGLYSVGVDHEFRVRPEAMEETLERAAGEGRHVVAVVAVVGTTEEGAVDPVDRVLDLRAARERAGKESFWVHADGAYGGYLRTLTVPARLGLGEPRSRVRTPAGVERDVPLHLPVRSACDALERLGECDSITIDPHKLGYVPYPAGCVCFRSDVVKPLTRQDAPYLADSAGDVEVERKSEGIGLFILEGSKPGAAAAGVWLSHTLIPLDTSGHGRLIRETIRNACELHALLEGWHALHAPEEGAGPPGAGTPLLPAAHAGVCAVALCAPGSNIVCYAFRPARAGATLDEINAANRRVYERFTLGEGRRVYDQQFFVSRTTLSARQYKPATVGPFLARLGVGGAEYESRGVFLLRSVLMNPWYQPAKQRGRHYLAELTHALHDAAAEEFARGR